MSTSEKSPAKPWERPITVASAPNAPSNPSPLNGPGQSTAFNNDTTATTDASAALSISALDTPKKPEERPAPMSTPMASTLGAPVSTIDPYSSMGVGTGYGMGMGGYGASPYMGGMGMGGMGMYGGMGMGMGLLGMQGLANNNQTGWLGGLMQVFNAFGSITSILNASQIAVTETFGAIMHMIERMTYLKQHLLQMSQTFVLFRAMKTFFSSLFGSDSDQIENDVSNFLEGKAPEGAKKPSTLRTMVRIWLFLGLILVGPPLLAKVWKAIRNAKTAASLPPPKPKVGTIVRTLFPFKGETEGDLPFETGSLLKVTADGPEGWITCELDGKKGMVPSNYVTKEGFAGF